MDREKLTERVRRLLALADTARNSSENEAEVAAKLAAKLMLENKIEMAEIKQSQDEFLILGCRAGNKQIPEWRKRLLTLLAQYGFCRVIVIRGSDARHRYGGQLFLVGQREDAETVRLLHDHVLTQINTLRARAVAHLAAKHAEIGQLGQAFGGYLFVDGRWVESTQVRPPSGGKLRQWKNQFNLGVVDGIAVALKNQRYKEMLDSSTRAIVRAADGKTMDFLRKKMGQADLKEEKKRAPEIKDVEAYAAGRVAAEMVSVSTGQQTEGDRRGYHLAEKAQSRGKE